MEKTKNEISWWTPFAGDREKELVLEVLSSQYLNEGKYVERFEDEVKRLLGVSYAVATTSGTAAIFLSLKSVGVEHGDEVLVPDITFIATANAVKLAGATPILVDVDPRTANIDIKDLQKKITKKTKAIIPVHVSGRSADMESVLRIAAVQKIAVVEDAAEAFNCRLKGKALGSLGNTGCFSFSANKTVATGQGGMVVTNDKNTYHQLRELKDHGRPVRGTGGDDTHHSIGFNFKMTNLQAAVGLGQLERLKTRQQRMKQIYINYQESLSRVEGLHFYGFSAEEFPQWTDAHSKNRDNLVNFLKGKGIHCRNFWHPLHTQKPYQGKDSMYPQSMKVGYESFWLPSSFLMTDEEQERVCKGIEEFSTFSKRKVA